MKIAFFGASELGYKCCEHLIQLGHTISCIFTIPQEFNISYSPNQPVKNVLFKDFNQLGEKFSIPVFQVNQNIKDYTETLKKIHPDFILAIGWYYMIPKFMLEIANKGAAGIHASLLPKYRGNAPLVWAMINGERETGISFFYFSDGVDDGDIIDQYKIKIEEEDNISHLLKKVEDSALQILEKNMPLISNNTANRRKQINEDATNFPKRSPEDGLINWNWEPQQIKNFIKAQTKPYPGAFTLINGKKVIIWDGDIETKKR